MRAANGAQTSATGPTKFFYDRARHLRLHATSLAVGCSTATMASTSAAGASSTTLGLHMDCGEARWKTFLSNASRTGTEFACDKARDASTIRKY